MEGEVELEVVEFPSVLQAESKIFGIFNTLEILIVFLASSVAWILLKDILGSVAVAIAMGIFATALVMKLIMPEEVGYLFPLYELKYLMKKKIVYAHELDTTKFIPAMDFVDGWIMKMKHGYGAVIEVQPVNFFYSTPSDQRAYVSAFKSLLNSIDFPIQILCLSAEFDMGVYMNRLLLRLKDEDIATNPILNEFVQAYIRWLDSRSRLVKLRKYYIVVTVPLSEYKGREDAIINELKRRSEVVLTGLRNGGISAKLLNREEILALYDLISLRRIDLPKNFNSAKVLIHSEERSCEKYGGGIHA